MLALVLSLAALDAEYYQRHLPGKLDANVAALEQAPRDAEHLWRLCRALVRRGERRAKKADKLSDFTEAREHCERSVSLSSTTAEAHFWLGVALGRYGEAKGVLKSLSLIKPIRREMAATLALDPGHGGAHQVLGQVLWKLPRFAGGDKREALREFEAAVRLSPRYTANYVPLAEAYLHFGEKEKAAQTLQAALAVSDPADPAAHGEDAARARRLLESLRD